jgi:hypothetical protein
VAADLGEPEAGLRRGDAHVAQQGEREAAGDRRSVHVRDERLREPGHRAERPRARLEQPLPVRPVAAELGDVHPRAERAPGAGEQRAVDRVVGGERVERAGQREAQLDRERVAPLGPVEREDRERAVEILAQRSYDSNGVVHRGGSFS